MNIAISGAGGFVGSHLSLFFKAKGDQVLIIPRIQENTSEIELSKLFIGVHVIINLAGAPIVGRWNPKYKKILFESRIATTRKIVDVIAMMEVKPTLLISASAVGIYASEHEQTESNFQLADDYLGYICQNWENEAKKAIPFTRVAIIRLGIVLGKGGGALARMIPLFKAGLGGKIASGNQGFSWIHISDVANAIEYIIENQSLSGEFNFAAPQVVDNKTFTKVLASVLKRPAFFAVPLFALRLIFGEGSIAVAGGQFAPPDRLLKEKFHFTFPRLNDALNDIIY
jgi:uncharacterized protein